VKADGKGDDAIASYYKSLDFEMLAKHNSKEGYRALPKRCKNGQT
jgi:hypothetical protein